VVVGQVVAMEVAVVLHLHVHCVGQVIMEVNGVLIVVSVDIHRMTVRENVVVAAGLHLGHDLVRDDAAIAEV
jgi:hypothetical protein